MPHVATSHVTTCRDAALESSPLLAAAQLSEYFLHIDNNGSTRDLTGLEPRMPVTVRTTNALLLDRIKTLDI